jgi:hypothetical protein
MHSTACHMQVSAAHKGLSPSSGLVADDAIGEPLRDARWFGGIHTHAQTVSACSIHAHVLLVVIALLLTLTNLSAQARTRMRHATPHISPPHTTFRRKVQRASTKTLTCRRRRPSTLCIRPLALAMGSWQRRQRRQSRAGAPSQAMTQAPCATSPRASATITGGLTEDRYLRTVSHNAISHLLWHCGLYMLHRLFEVLVPAVSVATDAVTFYYILSELQPAHSKPQC